MDNFEELIDSLDVSLFEKVQSQSTHLDKQSFLACQLALRDLRPSYAYLEIGSYLGGSIQPYLYDDRCRRIYSIDKRPDLQPDERGIDYAYENNSTARMLENLRQVAPGKMDKITTIDGDTGEIDPAKIGEKVQLCFIDGEHTDEAVVRDFQFSRKVLDSNGAIVFHDSHVTYNGIAECVKYLEKNAVTFNAYALPNIVFVIEIGDFPLHKHPKILERLINNHESYLFSLQNNDGYRQFATRFPFRSVRNFLARVRKQNVSQ